MQTIIVPTDFSDISLNAVNYAADMAIALHSSLLIIHSEEQPFSGKGFSSETMADETAVNEKLHAIKNNILTRTHNKITVHLKQVDGVIEDELIKVCDYKNPLAVIMATHGAGLREQFFIGSTTVYLSKNLEYPLVVVPAGVSFTPVNKVLLASDLENLYQLPLDKIINIISAFKAGEAGSSNY